MESIDIDKLQYCSKDVFYNLINEKSAYSEMHDSNTWLYLDYKKELIGCIISSWGGTDVKYKIHTYFVNYEATNTITNIITNEPLTKNNK